MNSIDQTQIEMVLTGVTPTRSLIHRIGRAYRLALEASPVPDDSALWGFVGHKQLDLHSALMSGDDDQLFDLLSNPVATNLYYGVDNLSKDVMVMIGDNWKGGTSLWASNIDELLVSLGICLLYNPEGGSRFPSRTRPDAYSIEAGLDHLAEHMGIDLTFPNPFAGEFGLPTSRGIVSTRALQAVYQALLARRYAAKSCIEIGGGMGRTGYYAHLLGVSYAIVDLPMTLVGQALFLGTTLGDDAVWMMGDEERRDGRITLLPPSEIGVIGPVDAVINVDSLTEMGEVSASAYIEWISANADTFISINHEANDFTSRQLCLRSYADSGRSRCVYWLRKGYVEEIFSFSATKQKSVEAERLRIEEARRAASWQDRLSTVARRIAGRA